MDFPKAATQAQRNFDMLRSWPDVGHVSRCKRSDPHSGVIGVERLLRSVSDMWLIERIVAELHAGRCGKDFVCNLMMTMFTMSMRTAAVSVAAISFLIWFAKQNSIRIGRINVGSVDFAVHYHTHTHNYNYGRRDRAEGGESCSSSDDDSDGDDDDDGAARRGGCDGRRSLLKRLANAPVCLLAIADRAHNVVAPASCRHLRRTRKGSNAYWRRQSCKDCGRLLHRWIPDSDSD